MPSSATQKPPEPHTYNEELRLAVEQNANMSSNKCCAPVRCSSTITPQCKKFNTLISKHICRGVEFWQLSCIMVLILSEGFKKALDLTHCNGEPFIKFYVCTRVVVFEFKEKRQKC